jgi:N-acetylglutamate synthase-like GNAT family acetyltransferase
MRHARPEDLDRLEPLLEKLRRLDGLKEKSRGLFYRGARAFLHFHEHEGGFFADVRLDLAEDFERLPATTTADRKALLGVVEKSLRAK